MTDTPCPMLRAPCYNRNMQVRREGQGARGAFRFVRWPLFVAANGALLLFVGVSAGRETYNQWKVDQQIKGLETQVQTLEGRRIQLLDTIQKLNSPDELDKEARLRLDLKKPGERVIVLKGLDVDTEPSHKGSQEVIASSRAQVSNPQKWFRYFFAHE